MREPVVSGSFYEDNFDNLSKQIENCFEKGPGTLPIKRKDVEIKGVISPHAGYFFSGKCMAWVYKEIGESKFPSVYVIIGTNHYNNETLVNLDDWKTPFGIIRNYGDDLGLEKSKMDGEHSIEVQLPFLQFVSKDRLKEVKILPIVTSSYNKDVVEKIRKIKNKVVIASSDFTHYGDNYNYKPFIYNKKENLYLEDKKAIDFILKLDVKGFLDYSKNKTICGKGAIAMVMDLCKDSKTRLVDYYTSGDVVNNYDNAVGYGGVVFV